MIDVVLMGLVKTDVIQAVYTEHTLLVVAVCLRIFPIRVSCINTTG